jgi:hypothetical protein
LTGWSQPGGFPSSIWDGLPVIELLGSRRAPKMTLETPLDEVVEDDTATAGQPVELRSCAGSALVAATGHLYRIIVQPVKGRAPGYWRADLEGGPTLLDRTRQPMLDAARMLLARGIDPAALITMPHLGTSYDSFRPVRLAIAAKTSTSEPAARSIHFRNWRPVPEDE